MSRSQPATDVVQRTITTINLEAATNRTLAISLVNSHRADTNGNAYVKINSTTKTEQLNQIWITRLPNALLVNWKILTHPSQESELTRSACSVPFPDHTIETHLLHFFSNPQHDTFLLNCRSSRCSSSPQCTTKFISNLPRHLSVRKKRFQPTASQRKLLRKNAANQTKEFRSRSVGGQKITDEAKQWDRSGIEEEIRHKTQRNQNQNICEKLMRNMPHSICNFFFEMKLSGLAGSDKWRAESSSPHPQR